MRSLRGRGIALVGGPIRWILVGWILIGWMWTGAAFAGGLYSNEFSTTAQANAGAGRGAWAPDASVAIHNPAAMTRLADHAFASGLSGAFGDIRFDPTPGSPSGNKSGGNQAGFAPLAGASYVHRISDRLRFGLSFYSLSGSILDPDDDWAGRFQLREISLLTITVSPTLAVRVTDWLSIGGGPLVSYGVMDWNLKANVLGTERNVRLDHLNDVQAAGRVGLLLNPTKDLSVSVYYNSETKFDLSGNAEGPLGLNPNLDTELPLAQFVEVGFHWQATERLALLGTFDWEDWSDANELAVTLAGQTIDATTGFEDTYKIGFGANYRIDPAWLLQTGVMYDSSPFHNRSRTVALPIDEQWRFSFGAQHNLTPTTKLGFSFTYVNLGRGEVHQASVVGDYKRNDLFVLGMTLAFDRLPWSGQLTIGGKDAGKS
jgi:long-chain fatty acid transport protein